MTAPETETLLATARRIVPGVEWRQVGASVEFLGSDSEPEAQVFQMADGDWHYWGPVCQHETIADTADEAFAALRDAIRAEAGRLLAMVGEALPEREASRGN